MTAAEATRAHAEGQRQAAELEPRLRRQYRSVLRGNARSVSAAYRAKSEVIVAASQGEENHRVEPTLFEILNATALAEIATARTRATRRRMALVSGGGLFPDAPAGFYDELLAQQAGKQAERLVAGTRDAVAKLIGAALEQGWSVDQTAAEIHHALNLDAEWRSEMLARTDLVSIGNAASQQSAQALGEDGPQWKVWLTAEDERVRDTHAEAAGQTVAIDESFDVGDSTLMYPGDPDGDDAETINCRCAIAYTEAQVSALEHSDVGGIQGQELPLAAAAAPTAILDEEVTMDPEQTETVDEEYEAILAASFTQEERDKLAKSGAAMSDGSYPIRNASDLSNAIQAIGRGSGSHAAIRAHIIKRAKALGLVTSLPEDWNVTASALVADAAGLCDLLDSALDAAHANLDAASLLASAIHSTYQAEEMAEGDPLAASAAPEDLDVPFLIAATARGSLPFPSGWFYEDEPDEPTPLTVTADGQVFGNLAEWNRCHTGFGNSCVMARPSPSGYAFFNVGQVITADGETVDVGKITVGTGHASMLASPEQVKEHYDNTGAVAAYVRVTDGKHGPWMCGSIEPEATERQIRDLRANGPSGDWRNIERRGRALDLLGILSVPKQGLPTPRALVASGDDGEEMVVALFAGGVECGCDEPLMDASEADVASVRLAALPAVR